MWMRHVMKQIGVTSHTSKSSDHVTFDLYRYKTEICNVHECATSWNKSGSRHIRMTHRVTSHICVAVCCSVLQRVAVCCSVLQCVAAFCNVLQCVAVCCSVLQCVTYEWVIESRHMYVLQCVAVCCSVLQCAAICCSVLHCVTYEWVIESRHIEPAAPTALTR